MSDYSKTDIGSGYNTQTAINTELGKIETAVATKMDKSGSTMTGDLDMNSNDILNTKNMDVQNLSISGTNVTAAGAAVSTLPDQSGNSAKVLSTNGATAEWVQGAAKYFATVADAQADTQLKVGEVIQIGERANALFDVIAATTNNGYDIIDATASSLSLQFRSGQPATAKSFGAVGNGATDDTAALTRLHAQHLNVYYEAGDYKVTSSIVLRRGTNITGEGVGVTYISGHGAGVFTVSGSFGDRVAIKGITFLSYTSGGTPDPRTNKAIDFIGTLGNTINGAKIERCYFQGWDICVDCQYTWSSSFDFVQTINCNAAFRLFGQSVNNSISNSILGANGSSGAVIDLVADGATIGEGLMISNSLIAQGAFGIRTNNGFLSLNITGSVIDLITDVAFKMVDTRTLSVSASWVFATNKCVEFAALGGGSPIDVKASFQSCHMTTTSTTGTVIDWGSNNSGLSVLGGSLTCGSNGRLLTSAGQDVSINSLKAINPSSNASFRSTISTSSFKIGREVVGNRTIEMTGGLASQAPYAIASVGITGATGAKISGFGATTSRTSIGLYRITYDVPLASALVIPQVSMRRTGQNAVTWEIAALTTTHIDINTYDATGALFDPTDLYVTIHN